MAGILTCMLMHNQYVNQPETYHDQMGGVGCEAKVVSKQLVRCLCHWKQLPCNLCHEIISSVVCVGACMSCGVKLILLRNDALQSPAMVIRPIFGLYSFEFYELREFRPIGPLFVSQSKNMRGLATVVFPLPRCLTTSGTTHTSH